jgi:release factor glutamine methyltransferase
MSNPVEGFAPADSTIGGLIREFAGKFEAAGFDTPRLDARILVAHALGVEPSHLFTRSDEALGAQTRIKIEKLIERRLAREPVSRIMGAREFWGLNFKLTPETLDPRPDTESLVSAVLELKSKFNDGPVRILDLGTGTGCILLAVLSEWPEATGVGIDINSGAVETAAENAVHLELSQQASFVVGNWAEGLPDSFDIVMSNPPYIAEDERSGLPLEVAKYDPSAALFGGADGLASYRALLPSARLVANPQGYLVLEVGSQQADAVSELLAAAGFTLEARKQDLAEIVRCLVAQAT